MARRGSITMERTQGDESRIRRFDMNRRNFLAGTTGAFTLATSLSAKASPEDRMRVLIPRWDIDEAHIRSGKNLRWVQQGSAGVEGVVAIPELVERDIVLTNMQRTFAPEIADQAIAYLLAFTRGLTHFIRRPPEGSWRRPPELALDELQGKTLLVIALGGIGGEIARRAFGFGMRVLASDPKVIEKPLFVEELHRPDAFHRLLPRADVVASAVPLTPLSRKMIGTKEFGMMKRGVILVNVSRGA